MRRRYVLHIHRLLPTHFPPHTQIDGAMRPPKREWEGATVRNLKTRCNAMLPIRVCDTNAAQYHRSCLGFSERVATTRGRQTGVFEQSVYDLRMLLSRICWAHSYSSDSNGGGPEHNFSVVPFLLQVSLHFMEQAADGSTHERDRARSLLSQLVSGYATPFLFHIEGTTPPVITAEFVFYLLTVSLHVWSIREWTQHKWHVVRSVVAYVLSTHSTKAHASKPLHLMYGDLLPAAASSVPSSHSFLSGIVDRSRLDDFADEVLEDTLDWSALRASEVGGSSSSSAAAAAAASAAGKEAHDLTKAEGVFAFLKPVLVFLSVIDGVHTALKEEDAELEDEAACADAREAAWVAALAKRLSSQQTKVVERMRVLRSRTVSEFLAAGTLQESLDSLGVLPHVLAEAPNAEQWAEQFLS